MELRIVSFKNVSIELSENFSIAVVIEDNKFESGIGGNITDKIVKN